MPRHRRAASTLMGVAVVLSGLAAVPQAQAAAPESPTVLSPSGGQNVDGLVSLAWNRPAGALTFDVQIDDSGDFATPLVSVTDTVNLRYVPVVELPAGDLWWRVRASDGTSESDWSTEAFSHRAKTAPDPIRPLADAVIQPPVDTPRFAWRPVEGATSYRLEVGPDPEFTDPALVTSSTQKTTAAVLTGYQLPGDYYWRVTAVLANGYSTAPSPALRYTVKGLPPAELTAPADSFDEPVREVVLDWRPVPGAVSYQLQIGTDSNFLSVVHSRLGVVGTRYSPPDGLDNDEYYWRVRPVDASGNPAPWPAEPWRFRRAWPDPVGLVHPSGTVSNDIPFFYQWDALEMASTYTVILFDADGRQMCTATTVHTTLANRCVPTSAGHYSWKVLARDEGGKLPDPTTDLIGQPSGSFHYVPPTPVTGSGPLTVEMVTGHAASMNGTAAYAVGRPRDVCTASLPATCVDMRQTPVLTWDRTPGAVGYRLVLAQDRELTNKIATFTVPDPIWTSATTLLDGQAGSAYFWAVQPCWTSTSCAPEGYARHSFAKKTVAPRLVDPVEVQVGATRVAPVVQDDVTLDWGSLLAAQRAPDAATGSSLATPAATEAQSYVVETAIDRSFNSVIERATVDQTTFTSYTSTYPEGPVYWRVQAIDGFDRPTAWSDTGAFEKRSPIPALITPADGATLGADYAFSWEPLAYAASYDLEIYAGPTKVAGATAWKHASWAPSDPLPFSAAGYTWRVRRVDATGRRGAWSESRRVLAPEVVPSTISPAAGATVAPSTSSFSWEPDARASSYRFERRRSGTTSLTENVTTRATGWAPTSTLAAGSWEWRVVTLDTRGAALGSSPWQAFTVVDPPAVVTPVSIAGSGEVGTDLRVSAPTFHPQVDSVSYQWYRGTTKILGATGVLYHVAPEDYGKSVTVQAIGVLAGYKPALTTSAPVVGVTGSALVAAHPPSIVGRPVVGETLAVDHGVWPADVRRSYQWFRASTPIPGATAASYRLGTADAGRSLHVIETASATGRAPGSAASDSVSVAKLPSSTAITLSSGRATTRQRVTAAVTVTVPVLSAPGGSVTVLDGTRTLVTVPLTASTVQVKLPRLPRGRHWIKAVYQGTAQVGRSSDSARVRITR